LRFPELGEKGRGTEYLQ